MIDDVLGHGRADKDDDSRLIQAMDFFASAGITFKQGKGRFGVSENILSTVASAECIMPDPGKFE